MDKRFDIMYERLKTFNLPALYHLHDAIINNKVCYDEFNYDEQTSKFCPIAILMRLDEKMENPTNESVSERIRTNFDPVNAIKGVQGNFYHGTPKERESDLLGLINVLICKYEQANNMSGVSDIGV